MSLERLEGESDQSYRRRVEAFEKAGALIWADSETLEQYELRLFGRRLTADGVDTARREALRALRDLDPDELAAALRELDFDPPDEAFELALSMLRGTVEWQAAGRSTTRLEAAFARGPALVGYVPLGDPLVPPELPFIYVECGVDVLELGVPAERPFLDGETIAASMARARGTDAVAVAGALRTMLPAQALVWMGYRERPDEELARDVLASGVDALLVPEPAARLQALAARVPLVPFVGADDDEAPPPGPYVMVQAARGLTGVRSELGELAARIAQLRVVGSPLVLGFGISTGEHVREALALGADGVVVGSALVEAALDSEAALRRLLRELDDARRG